MKFKAVLFDFDGVIADTMNDNFLAWKKSFKKYNCNIKRKDYLPLEGMKLIKIAEVISKKYFLKDVSPKLLENLKNKHYKENHSFKFYAEIPKLIKRLKDKGIKLAIVSSSPREKLDLTIPKDFLANFDAVVSGDDVSNGKPSPEPYLMALKRIKMNHKDCIVIENAPLGIQSAKEAGIYCIALTTTLNKNYLSDADKIFKNHGELTKKLFKNENKKILITKNLAEICKESLLLANKILETAGNRATQEVFDDGVVDLSTKGDRIISSTLINFFKSKKIPAILQTEESGTINLSKNPKYMITIDDIDGTNNYHRGRRSLPHCTVVSIFDSIKPKFKDVLIAGIIEHISKKIWISIRGQGCYLNGIKINVPKKTDLNKKTLIVIDHYANSKSISKLNKIYLKSWVKDFGSAAFHLAGISSGLFDGYVSYNQKAHELGAGYLLIKESGGSVIDTKGNHLNDKPFNFKDTYDVIATPTQELGKKILNKLEK